jgi:hypothetical protein
MWQYLIPAVGAVASALVSAVAYVVHEIRLARRDTAELKLIHDVADKDGLAALDALVKIRRSEQPRGRLLRRRAP